MSCGGDSNNVMSWVHCAYRTATARKRHGLSFNGTKQSSLLIGTSNCVINFITFQALIIIIYGDIPLTESSFKCFAPLTNILLGIFSPYFGNELSSGKPSSCVDYGTFNDHTLSTDTVKIDSSLLKE